MSDRLWFKSRYLNYGRSVELSANGVGLDGHNGLGNHCSGSTSTDSRPFVETVIETDEERVRF
jgi:hypothetical protein